MSILWELKRNLSGAADYTVRKTGEVTEATKIRMEIRAENAKLSRLYENIGRAYCKKEEGIAEAEVSIAQYMKEAAELRDKIASLRADLAALQGKVICSACGAVVHKVSVYCPMCGVKLAKPETTDSVEAETEE